MTDQPLTQAQDHDRRLGRLEGIAEQLDRRLDAIEKRIESIERTLRQELAELRARSDAQFRWLVGIQITTLIAIGGLLLNILSKLPD